MRTYRDTWGKGLDSYLKWFYETVVLLRELLSEKGSIYVQLDYRVGRYAKLVLDEVFGREHFLDELIWFYPGSSGRPYDKFTPKHDNLFRYPRTDTFVFMKHR